MAPTSSRQQKKGNAFTLPPEAPNDFTSADLDFMYNDSDRDDDIGATPNVLVHLLTQVTIGMDLTKITLPTQILERRSLLELYATFFTHADLFLNISSFETPRDRMVAMVGWYMSAYHVSLKPKRPKKPYNPVLGEIFRCFYRVDDEAATTSPRASRDGPLPWAKSSDLVFLAEQVSHQPPISAFYAECPTRQISCQAYVHTKTQFRGAYAVVQLVGKGKVMLHSHNEEFHCNFPTVYIRSLFSSPWMEFGDTVTIECPRTRMSCEVKFVTRGIFGGESNSIKGQIKDHGNTFAKLSGRWNDVVYISYAAKGKRAKADFNEKEVLFDTSAKRYKMQVRPLDKQEPFESRRIWSNVTYHLWMNNIELASFYKSKVEDSQRQLKLSRERSSESWIPREFTAEDDGWFYRNRAETD